MEKRRKAENMKGKKGGMCISEEYGVYIPLLSPLKTVLVEK